MGSFVAWSWMLLLSANISVNAGRRGRRSRSGSRGRAWRGPSGSAPSDGGVDRLDGLLPARSTLNVEKQAVLSPSAGNGLGERVALLELDCRDVAERLVQPLVVNQPT